MALFYWNTHLETGNVQIDSQHKRLFELTNNIADAVSGQGSLPEVQALLAELIDYANTHFCDEEKLMCRSSLGESKRHQHICAHRSFYNRVQEIAAKADLEQAEAVNEILNFLVNWLVGHILKLDHRMVHALPERADENASALSVQEILIAALNESERRFRQLAEQAPTMLWFAGISGAREFVNREWTEFMGLAEADMKAADWVQFLHPDDRESYRAFLDERLRKHDAGLIEYRILAKDGHLKWVLEKVMPRLDEDRFVGLIGADTDITAMKETTTTLEQLVAQRTRELERLVNSDPLTGLLNRRAFDERLDLEIQRAQRYDRPLSLLFIDIDHFKEVNDRYGHVVGDEVLRAVATVLKNGLRATDAACRYGGEEFAVILVETDRLEARSIAERIRVAAESNRIDQLDKSATISVGISVLSSKDMAVDLIQRADDSMYVAKKNGRNQSYMQ
ncbi:bacteriohemerythrin [Pleomorphomonas sp. JP5]|uniref:bacteriohemerythrin n=1 Tax=Pleomorphomonas sp. JP5 TaxID=2942998 RepID=UPI002042FEED|nr:bacteriohemerythrin [Pleomorphomonas sp. JP5]MCM5556881.1 bacteriohemerythrin [Pleomorphomonas sp. JP5]